MTPRPPAVWPRAALLSKPPHTSEGSGGLGSSFLPLGGWRQKPQSWPLYIPDLCFRECPHLSVEASSSPGARRSGGPSLLALWETHMLGNLVTSIKMKIMDQRFSQCRFLVQQWLSQTLASPSGSPRPPLLSHLPGPHIPLNDHEHWETSLHPRPTWSSALPAFTVHGLPDGRG